MQIQAYDFQRNLDNKPLPPFILVFGDEPQQKIDIVDAVRKKAKANGFDERQTFTLDSDFEWAHLIDAMQSMSLFADKQYIELNMNSVKPGTAGAKNLVDIASLDNPDVVLLIQGPKAGKDVQKTKWFSALSKNAWFTHVYDLEGTQLQKWLSARANALELNISQQAISMIADLCEGNLMAGRQELEKLQLQFPATHVIEADDISKVMMQQSRYSVFQFSDELLAGNITKAIKILCRLEEEGIEPVVILWNMVNEALLINKMIEMQKLQGQINFRALRVWPNKQRLYQNALQRLNEYNMNQLIHKLSQADVMLKSEYIAKPFVLLSHLAMLFVPYQLNEFNIA